MARELIRLIAVMAAVTAAPVAASAQQEPAARPAAKTSQAGSHASTQSALQKRVEQLEEQLVDLQVVIGTLESLAKAPRGPAPGAAPDVGFGGGADQGRINSLETQIRALTQQMEQLSAEVRGGGDVRRSDAGGVQPGDGALRPDAGVYSKSTTPDPIGGLLAAPLPEINPAPAPAPDSQMAAVQPSEDPKTAYEKAYAHMLQQDYAAAQSGFSDFLKRFTGHALVPNALYWLGETYYVQRNYADATEAFDIVLSAYGTSNKAPDSQLKKAMAQSLQGKNADACSTLRELAVKYPNAPDHVKTKADSERRRVGCT